MPDQNSPLWRKSSYSGNGNACVEVASLDSVIAVRDSKDPAGPALRFASADWAAFVATVKTGGYDPA